MAEENLENMNPEEPGAGAGEPGADPKKSVNNAPPGPVPYERFAAINAELRDLRKWRKEQEELQAQTSQEQQKAEEGRLAEQQQWQQLAEKQKAKVMELEPRLKETTERLAKYEAALKIKVAAEMAKAPEHLRDLLEKLDVVEQLEWLAEHPEALKPAMMNGVPATPAGPPNGQVPDNEAKKKAVNARSYW